MKKKKKQNFVSVPTRMTRIVMRRTDHRHHHQRTVSIERRNDLRTRVRPKSIAHKSRTKLLRDDYYTGPNKNWAEQTKQLWWVCPNICDFGEEVYHSE